MTNPGPNSLNDLKARCRLFNAAYPIGTRVMYHPVIGETRGKLTTTRTGAYVLSGHTAVVMIEGLAGCVALDAIEIMPINPEFPGGDTK